MAPVVDRLAIEYGERVEFRLINVDTDPEGAALAARFGVQYVPTFVLLNADGTQSDLIVGTAAESALREALDALR
jgi:thioredoxin-like negative regulator of GroEL